MAVYGPGRSPLVPRARLARLVGDLEGEIRAAGLERCLVHVIADVDGGACALDRRPDVVTAIRADAAKETVTPAELAFIDELDRVWGSFDGAAAVCCLVHLGDSSELIVVPKPWVHQD